MTTPSVTYALEPNLDPEAFIDVLVRSSLAERRPVDEPEMIRSMLEHADVIVTARVAGLLVGISRAITDFSYCTYLSDLAVDRAFQRRGIGRELVRSTHEEAASRPSSSSSPGRAAGTVILSPHWDGAARLLLDHPPQSVIGTGTIGMSDTPTILIYQQMHATCREHDTRAMDVARRLGSLIESHLPGIRVEHVGSTSVPHCAGKGVVDLMVLYPPGQLPAVRDMLDELGFQRQTTRDPFPEERPMRTGAVDHDGTRFQVHAHVIAADAPEASELRAFRERLRADPRLVDAYVARKRAILAEGVTDSLDYSVRKGGFVAAVLEALRVGKLNLREKLSQFDEHWTPKIVGALNGQHVKLVKLLGEFVWHHHEHEDELFLVIHGRFRMEFRDRHVWLEEGELLIVPRGIEHRPVAEAEAHVLLFEPATTLNTGNVRDERTVIEPERI